jgi:hypothetical protein
MADGANNNKAQDKGPSKRVRGAFQLGVALLERLRPLLARSAPQALPIPADQIEIVVSVIAKKIVEADQKFPGQLDQQWEAIQAELARDVEASFPDVEHRKAALEQLTGLARPLFDNRDWLAEAKATAEAAPPPAEDKAGQAAADAVQNAVIETAEVVQSRLDLANKDATPVKAEATAEGKVAPRVDSAAAVAAPAPAPVTASTTVKELLELAGQYSQKSEIGRLLGKMIAWAKKSIVLSEEEHAELVRKINESRGAPVNVVELAKKKIAQVKKVPAQVGAGIKTAGKTAKTLAKAVFIQKSANPPEVQPKATLMVAAAVPAPELPPDPSAGTQAAPNAPDQEAPAESGAVAPVKPAAPQASAEADVPPQPEKTAAVSHGEPGGDNGSSGSQGDKDPQQASLAPAFVTLISATKPVEDSEKSDPAQMFTRMLQNWQAIIQAIKDDPASVYQGVARFGDAGGKETEKSENAAAILGSISSRRNSDFKLDFRVTGNRFEAALDYKKGEKYVDEQEELAAYVFALGVLTTWKSPTGNGEIPLVIGGSKEFRKYFAQALQDPETQKIAVARGLKKINFVTEVGKTTPDTIEWTEEDGALHSFNHIVFAPPAAKPAPAPPPPKPDPAEAPPANAAVDSSEAGQANLAATQPPPPVNAGTEQGTAAAEVPAEKEAAKIPAATQAAAVGGEVIPPVKAGQPAAPVTAQTEISGVDQGKAEALPAAGRAEETLREVIYLPPPEKMPPLKGWPGVAEEIADADTLEREEPALQRRATRVPLRAQSEQNRRRIVRPSFQTVRKKIEINHVLARSKGELPNRPVALGRAARRGSNAPVKRLERV